MRLLQAFLVAVVLWCVAGFQVSTKLSQPSFGRAGEVPEKTLLKVVTVIPWRILQGHLEGSESYMPEQGDSFIGTWFPETGRQPVQRIWEIQRSRARA